MTYNEINSDRQAFQHHVLESAKTELAEQGISVDVLNIRGILTPGSTYSEDLAMAELAAARRDADIAKARANQESEFAKIQAAEQIAQRQRDLSLKQAEYKGETDRADANALAASSLARAEQDAKVADLERAALTQRALVQQEQLDIDTKKPADAAAYATRIKAEGDREAAKSRAEAQAYERKAQAEAEAFQRRTQAEAEAFQRKVTAEAEAAAVLALAKSQAEAGLVKGEAEASVTRQIGEAEAAATQAKAEALEKYGRDALVYELVTRLPDIMKANAEAVSSIKDYTVIGTQGASDAVVQASAIGAQTVGAIKSLTGVDLAGLAKSVVDKNNETTSSTE
ncbi:DNA helicase [Platysternon megacephalum]|uniref:Flotillin n=1 Tax=Platysternon megacephalum TaxID=55544 RepID=A0A4D9DDR5_9SAUR|nr:DNA helicase [Platysternon megacephalum]